MICEYCKSKPSVEVTVTISSEQVLEDPFIKIAQSAVNDCLPKDFAPHDTITIEDAKSLMVLSWLRGWSYLIETQKEARDATRN